MEFVLVRPLTPTAANANALHELFGGISMDSVHDAFHISMGLHVVSYFFK